MITQTKASTRALTKTKTKTSNTSTTLSESGYSLDECIGKGQYGQIFRCSNDSNHSNVAVKKVRLACLTRQEQNDLKNEVMVAGCGIRHDRIVTFLDIFCEEDESICFVLEYCGGGDVLKFIKARGFGLLSDSANEKKFDLMADKKLLHQWSHDILEGLEFLHLECGIIHRDMKPQVFKYYSLIFLSLTYIL